MADFQKKVALIEIDIDQAEATKQVENLTDSIVSQKKAIKENTDEIKKLSKGTEEEKKQAEELEKQNFKLRDELKDLNKERAAAVKATKLQSNSLDALRKKSSDLKKQLNAQETATEDGRKAFEKLQVKLNDVNDQIVELDQGAGDFKTTVGRYKEELGGAIDASEAFTGGLGGMVKGFAASTRAALTFLATPIGVVLGAVGVAIGLVANALNRSEKSTNKLRRAFAPLEGMLNLLLKALEPLGEFLINRIVNRMELAAKAVSFFTKAIADGLDLLGFDKAAESVREYNNEIERAGKAAVELADAEAKLREELRKQDRIQLEFQQRAEKLRQLRDDESRSIQQRKKDNEELGKVLQEQSARELEIANLALSVVDRRIAMEGETSDLLDERAEALLKIAEINERITSQESEQLSNLNALRKEQADLDKERLESAKAEAEKQAQIEKDLSEKKVENQKNLNEKLRKLEDFRRNQKYESMLSGLEDEQEIFEIKQEQEAQNFQSEMNRIALEEEALVEAQNLTEEERAIRQADIDLAKEEALAEHKDRLLELTKGKNLALEDEEKRSEKAKAEISEAGQKIQQGIYEYSNRRVADFYDDRIERVKDQLARGQINEEQAAKKIQSLERQKALDQWRVERAKFRVEKATSIFSILFNLAKAQAKATGASPLTAGEPWNTINRVILLGQLGIVASRKAPKAPSFAEGGTVVEGKSHSQGGEDIYVGGQYYGNMQGGEGLFITKREATTQALDYFNTMHGGRSMFENSSRYLEQGGRAEASAINEDLFIKSIQAMPPAEVRVTDIMSGIQGNQEANNLGVI